MLAVPQPAPGGDVDALDQMARILDRPPMLAADALRNETRITRRWSHGALHEKLPGLPGHVIIGHYGAEHDISLRAEGRRIAGRTRPGTLVVIPEGSEGRWDIEGTIEVSHVYLTQERLQQSADQLTDGRPVSLIDRVCFEDPTTTRILAMLSDEATSDGPSARLFLEQAIDLLCIQLVRGHSSFGSLQIEAPRRGLADWQVKRVTAYMRDRLEQEIGLNELAALVNLSRFHFCTAFRHATGRTPHEWLTQARIARARELLADPALRITDIALAVGYETPSSFAASFRKVAGVTPTEFRRRL